MVRDVERAKPGSKTTTHGIVARDADVAIVLRRGPTRRVRMLRWNLRSDTLEGGQWLVGTVQFGACSVSPDGELFVYFARKGAREFTCVSRPPYFTALAFWESQLPWTGGGYFADNDHLVLGVTHPPNKGSLPRWLTVSEVWSHLAWNGNKLKPSRDTFGDAVLKTPEARQHWHHVAHRYRKPNPSEPSLVLERDASPGLPGKCRLVRTTTSKETIVSELGLLDWADWAKGRALVFGDAGRHFRQHVSDRKSTPTLVADLTTQTFERLEAPNEAHQWPRGSRRTR